VSSTVPSKNLARPIVPKKRPRGSWAVQNDENKRTALCPVLNFRQLRPLRLPRLPNSRIHSVKQTPVLFPRWHTTRLPSNSRIHSNSHQQLPPITLHHHPRTHEGEREEACVCPRIGAALLGAVGRHRHYCAGGDRAKRSAAAVAVGSTVSYFVDTAAAAAGSRQQAAGSRQQQLQHPAEQARPKRNHPPRTHRSPPRIPSRAEPPWPQLDLSLPLPVGGSTNSYPSRRSVENSKRKNKCQRRAPPPPPLPPCHHLPQRRRLTCPGASSISFAFPSSSLSSCGRLGSSRNGRSGTRGRSSFTAAGGGCGGLCRLLFCAGPGEQSVLVQRRPRPNY
jgi:hypothetical protein